MNLQKARQAWKKLDELAIQVDTIREDLSRIVDEAGMEYYHTWDIEGIIRLLEGAARYMKTFGEIYAFSIAAESEN